jgi:phosphatidate cytidylyltransferase
VVAIGLIGIDASEMIRLKPGPPSPHPIDDRRPGFRRAIAATASGSLAMLYLGLPLGALVAVHQLGGRGAVVLLIATVVVSDTAQYYAGRTFGRRPLAPELSPKKTVEGAIGGFLAAPIFLGVAGPALVPAARPLAFALVGIAMVIAGIAGDLFESMLKRAADMKDSSALIPGHGGVLDRIDALLFATPMFYLYLRWLEIA